MSTPSSQKYPFVDRRSRPARCRALELLRVFLYTVFVFFSIKIDLDRLKVTNPWLLAYFFLQWLVGLWLGGGKREEGLVAYVYFLGVLNRDAATSKGST